MSLRTRIHPELDHRPALQAEAEQPPVNRKPFVAPWRRKQIEQAEARERLGRSRYEAVHDTTGAVTL